MIKLFVLVAIGGAIGSVGRFWMAIAVARLTGTGFPWGTVLINILGSCLIGWLAGLSLAGRMPHADSLRAFAIAGVCGGFTTFSSFSLQTVELMREGQPLAAAANVCVSVILCLLATTFGLWLARP
jgi:CrcB protein